MKISLRSLFALIALSAVACAAMKFAGPVWWSIVSAVSLLLFMALAVVAFVGHGAGRVFAIGFIVCALIYAGLLLVAGSEELNPDSQGRLPTTKLLSPVFKSIVRMTWFDFATNQETPNHNPAKKRLGGLGPVRLVERPQRLWFMSIGHLIWTMLLGCCGGLFARCIHGEEEEERQS